MAREISDPGSLDTSAGTLRLRGTVYRISEQGVLTRHDRAVDDHYAETFGFEWAHFRYVQADSALGLPKSEHRLRNLIDRPLEDLSGKTVLEVGAGGGRFTEILVRLARSVICLEPSSAAHLNIAAPKPNLIVIQEDLENNPIDPRIVDVVVCRGVVQHTPKPMEFIDQLIKSVRPGGWVFFDFYARGNRLIHPRYWLRHVTKRLSPEATLRMCEKLVPPLTRFKWRLDDLGLSRKLTSRLVPVIDTRGEFGYLTESQLIRANVLETFDCYTPRYDHPPLAKDVLRYLRDGGHEFLSPPNLTANFFRVRRASAVSM